MAKVDPKKISGARKGPMPGFVSPQLATLESVAPEGEQWLHELKFDGYRMLVHISPGEIRVWSRNAKDWTEKFKNLIKSLSSLAVKNAILDGEVVVVDQKGRSSFQRLQQSMGGGAATFVYQAFDVIYLDGYSLVKTPLIERKAVLEKLLTPDKSNGQLRYSDHVTGSGAEFFRQACEYGIEGIVSKLAMSPYESTRNKNWLKVKCHKRQEFVVVGYTPSKNNFPGFGSLILGVYENGNLVYTGRVGTGFSIKQRVELQQKLDRIVQKTMPFGVKPKDPGLREARWTKPKFVAEVEFTEWTGDGAVRHPSFKGLRADKKPADVVREDPI
jgi:bifunctional non-homologous end joining protein LigD